LGGPDTLTLAGADMMALCCWRGMLGGIANLCWSGRLERRCRRAAGGGDDGDEGGSGAGAGGWLSPEGDESVGRYARAGGQSVSQCRGSQSGRDSCRLGDAAGMRDSAAAGREGRRGRDASVAVLGHPLSRWLCGIGEQQTGRGSPRPMRGAQLYNKKKPSGNGSERRI
jgi:hypothetical protein